MSTATIETTGLKLTCQAKAMLDAVTLAGSVVKATTPSLIMQNVKLAVAEDGTATVSATDGEVQIRVGVDGVESSGAGSILLPPEKVAKILKKAEGESVSFEVDGSEILIVDGRSKFRLPWMDPTLLPEVEPCEVEDYHEVQAGDLAKAIKRTLYATADPKAKPKLAGVHVEFGDTTVTLVAYDGNRLARMTIPGAMVGGGSSPGSRPVVPTKGVQAIDRLASGERPVQLAMKPKRLLARSGSVEMSCPLLASEFPKYERVMDEESTAAIPFVVGNILDAVDRAAITASDESRGVRFAFSAGQLSLSSRVSDRGSSSVVIDADYLERDADMFLDSKYVGDVFKAMEPESTVEMVLLRNKDRVRFKGHDGYMCMVACQEKGTN